jgi:voltage-gated potassium channel|tara:strand:+ start:4223 stop:5041 length:819 start_codon:yes stop_codon:yes gene_type:complete
MKEVPKFKSFKERIHFYFEDVETWPGRLTDFSVIFLVVISSIIFVTLSTDIPDFLRNNLERADAVIVIIFSVEYLLRFWVAEKKIKHFFNLYSAVDLIAILPFYLGFMGLGFIRVFRVFRILRLVRFIKKRFLIARITSVDAYFLVRIFFTLFAIIFVSSGLIFFIEHEVNPERFGTFFDAVYYSVVTLTTVGFGDITPVSIPGRLVTIGMIISGIIFIPWQLGAFLKRIIYVTGKVKVTCKKCGLQYHESDATHCKTCGSTIFIPEREKYV